MIELLYHHRITMEAFRMKKIFVLVFVLIMTFSFVACSDNSANQVVEEEARQDEQVVNTPEAPIEAPAVEEPEVEQSMVDVFIERYNATAPTVITDAVEVDVTDEESGHYRTEFRLGAFEGSIAKTGRIGDIVIDIVNCGWDNDELRIYADGITQEQAVEIVKYAAPIMDSEVSDADLQDVLD